MEGEIKDLERSEENWKKMQYNHKSLEGDNTTIHYWENKNSGEKELFKFKDGNSGS